MRSSARFKLFVLLAIFIMGLIVYSPATKASFFLDDNSRIVENSLIRSFSSMQWLWEYDPSRFIPHLTFAFNYYLDGVNPFGYHLGNILIHIINSIIVFFLARILLSYSSLIGTRNRPYLNYFVFGTTLIFLLHPIQTSAVTYVVQRSTLLAATFYFSSILLYLLFKLKKSKVYYSGALISTALGFLCKPLMITLPFVIILIEMFCVDEVDIKPKRRFFNVLPFFVIVGIFVATYVLVMFKSFSYSNIGSISRETVVISRTSYLLTEFNVLVTYLRLLIFPFNQNLDYDYPISTSLLSFPTGLSFLILISLLGLAWNQSKKQPLISFCILWFFLTLSSESSLFPISDVIFEHRLYIAMLGFALLLPFSIILFVKKRNVVYGVMASLILFFSMLSYCRNDLWSHKTEFLIDVVTKSPNKARANLNLGAHYSNIGNYRLALFYIDKALVLEPDCAAAFYSKALLNEKLGDKNEALSNYSKVILLNSLFINAYVNRGFIYLMDENYSLALKDFTFALKINPQDENANNNMGVIYFKQANYPAALDYFNRVIKINPKNPDILNNIKILQSLQKTND